MVAAADAGGHIRLVMLVNDVSLRNLIPAELAKGFGFYQSKPASSFSPVAVTPDELGEAWRDSRVHLPLRITLNGKEIGLFNDRADADGCIKTAQAASAGMHPLRQSAVTHYFQFQVIIKPSPDNIQDLYL